MKTAKQVIQRIKTIAVKEVGGVHFDREEAQKLRENDRQRNTRQGPCSVHRGATEGDLLAREVIALWLFMTVLVVVAGAMLAKC